jgi:hypothetical protein
LSDQAGIMCVVVGEAVELAGPAAAVDIAV